MATAVIVTDDDVRVAVHAHMTALFASTAKADRRIKEPILWTYFSGLDRGILEAVEADRARRRAEPCPECRAIGGHTSSCSRLPETAGVSA